MYNYFTGDTFHQQMLTESISRGLRGVQRKEKIQEDANRTYYYRHPSDPTRLKTIQRLYSTYTKAYTTVVDSNFVVMEPLENWIEISKSHLQTLMRMSEKIPYRYGTK